MTDNKYNSLKTEKKIKRSIREKLDRVGARYPRLANSLVMLNLFLGLGVVSFVVTLVILIYQEGKRKKPITLPAHTENMPQQKWIESPFERRIYDEKYNLRCDGAEFDIIDELSPVGGERFTFPLIEDDHVASVSGTPLFQGSYKTTWGCTFPFETTIGIIPVSGPSLGLFLEVENVYKVVVGDGDKLNVKLQRNNLGYRGEWEEVFREKLSKPIEDKKPLTLILQTRKVGEWIQTEIRIYHSGLENPDTFYAEFLPPTASAPEGKEYRFRTGINDFRYKGEGSLVRLETLSVTEIDD